MLAASAAMLVLGTIVGLVALWPHDRPPSVSGSTGAGATVGATVVAKSIKDCGGPTRQQIGPTDFAPDVDHGQAIRVLPSGGTYAFAEVDRRAPLLWLAVAVAIVAVVLVRGRGLLAIAGLAVSLLLVTRFVLPATLGGSPPLLVALTGAMAVTIVTLVLTSGFGMQSMTAFVGIAATLLVAAVVGVVFAHVDHLDGRSNDAANALIAAGRHISLQGVVVAGVVLGALGALTDTAVTQASTVMALRRTAPTLTARRLYREAFAVGRDHLSATVHTLVLAYVGATLAFLLALNAGGTPLADALSSQQLAEPIAATLIGTLALLLCVPVTTSLAVLLASRLPAAAVPSGHEHVH
jgi:uncharacterized membrane protein